MTREKMERRGAGSVYLHKDFHAALSCGLEYLERKYGPDAVREYLWSFAREFYAPLTQAIRRRGLLPLKEYLEEIYRLEGGRTRTRLTDAELTVEVEECPAVRHMKERGYAIAGLFSETTRTVNEAICEGTPYRAELLEYDEATGRSVMRFSRRRP